jgi:uncharacterized membrane protein (UPF0136 family)
VDVSTSPNPALRNATDFLEISRHLARGFDPRARSIDDAVPKRHVRGEDRGRGNFLSNQTAGYVICYGLFLIVSGVLGYLSNPEKAGTALISGGTFGLISMLWGVLGARGKNWARPAAIATSAFLGVVFLWRSTVSWIAVVEGRADKRTAALLITAMLAASVAMLIHLLNATSARSSK